MKAIIRFKDNGGRLNYVCNYEVESGKILQCSNSYQTGTIEFDTIDEAKKVAENLKLGKNKLTDWEAVEVK